MENALTVSSISCETSTSGNIGIISLIVLLVELFNNDDIVKSIVDVCVEDWRGPEMLTPWCPGKEWGLSKNMWLNLRWVSGFFNNQSDFMPSAKIGCSFAQQRKTYFINRHEIWLVGEKNQTKCKY